MKIAVCINYVPDTASKIKLTDDNRIDENGLSYVINPFDEFAIEEALKTKEKFGGEIFAISAGNDAKKEGIKKALAMGVDNGILLKYDGYMDPFNIADNLAAQIKTLGSNIVFFGRQSVDYDNGITGLLTAELLNYNCISIVTKLDIQGNEVTAEREIEGGKEVVKSTLPIVITTQKGLNEPRYATLKGIMASKKKVIEEINITSVSNLVENVSYKLPKVKNPGRILGSDASAVNELVKLLRDEAKII
ncbi:MAG: electron transfer flavoprotein subunit beta/FixA family protein [Bacteroidota bacterium]|nr:electron transfer flavoprotein subunit beta/FixA family protein [Bacteroidota bacterium]